MELNIESILILLGIAVVLMFVYFIFKNIVKLFMIAVLLVGGFFGYQYYQEQQKPVNKVKRALGLDDGIENIQDAGEEALEKGKEAWEEGKETTSRLKERTQKLGDKLDKLGDKLDAITGDDSSADSAK